jgi:hypothetical protein
MAFLLFAVCAMRIFAHCAHQRFVQVTDRRHFWWACGTGMLRPRDSRRGYVREGSQVTSVQMILRGISASPVRVALEIE